MSNGGIKIPVSADLDSADISGEVDKITKKINEIGQAIAKANKVAFNPLSGTPAEIKKVIDSFEQLKRVHADLNRRINATGQKGVGLQDIDWARMYPDPRSRNRQMAQVFGYVTGGMGAGGAGGGMGGGGGGAGGGGTGHPPPASGGGFGSMAINTMQAGMRATGAGGGVAANALGTGMVSGAGAGMMGLMGGMLALGVGKIVGAVVNQVGKAEDNEVAYDKLKRTLGDVNIAFDGLKSVIKGTASNVRLTFDETARLGTQFAKLGNLTSNQYTSIKGELETGVGLSRAFGVDPSQGVGVMGQMRGMKVTNNVQESRKFALLIGETIGKSGAFAKADEVMEAMANYATLQTRASMGGANVSGFAGMYSGMVGSGIPGLDTAGTGALLARINSSLSAGGSKGEASQFFTAQVGSRMGLDPIQTQIMREGGAFSTNDSSFGKGSIAERYGISGPGGNKTFLEGSLEELRNQYGNNKGLLAQATSNHLGIGMRQAMALLSVEPNKMGEMEKYGDLTKMNAAGIGNLSKVLYGSDDDRQDIARNLQRRTGADALTLDQSNKLESTMKTGTVDEQKAILANLVASRDQERTTGSDIRDSKNILDNVKTNIAEKLVPLTLEMRHGIMHLAGAGKGKTSEEIMQEVLTADSKGRRASIAGNMDRKLSPLTERQTELQDRLRISKDDLARTYGSKPEVLASKLKEREANVTELDEISKKVKALEKEKSELLEKENTLAAKRIEDMKADFDKRRSAEDAEKSAAEDRERLLTTSSSGTGGKASSGTGAADAALKSSTASGLDDVKDPKQRTNLKSFLDTLSATEGANYNTVVGGGTFGDYSQHPNKVGLVTGDGPSTAAGRYQITGTTWKGVSKQLGLKDFSPESQDKAAIELLRRRGALDDVLAGNWDSAIRKLGDEWQSLPSGTSKNQGKRSREFFDSAMGKAQERNSGTPMPSDAAAEMKRESNRGNGFNLTVDPLKVVHENSKGEQVAPPQTLTTKVTAAKPFGA